MPRGGIPRPQKQRLPLLLAKARAKFLQQQSKASSRRRRRRGQRPPLLSSGKKGAHDKDKDDVAAASSPPTTTTNDALLAEIETLDQTSLLRELSTQLAEAPIDTNKINGKALKRVRGEDVKRGSIVVSGAYFCDVDENPDTPPGVCVDCWFDRGRGAGFELLTKVKVTDIALDAGRVGASQAQRRRRVAGLDTAETLRHMFRVWAPRPCVGYEAVASTEDGAAPVWRWRSFADVARRARGIGYKLSTLDIAPGAFVGICAENCAAYLECEWALFVHNYVAVPLSLSLTPLHMQHVIRESRVVAIFADAKHRSACERALEAIAAEDKKAPGDVQMLELSSEVLEKHAHAANAYDFETACTEDVPVAAVGALAPAVEQLLSGLTEFEGVVQHPTLTKGATVDVTLEVDPDRHALDRLIEALLLPSEETADKDDAAAAVPPAPPPSVGPSLFSQLSQSGSQSRSTEASDNDDDDDDAVLDLVARDDNATTGQSKAREDKKKGSRSSSNNNSSSSSRRGIHSRSRSRSVPPRTMQKLVGPSAAAELLLGSIRVAVEAPHGDAGRSFDEVLQLFPGRLQCVLPAEATESEVVDFVHFAAPLLRLESRLAADGSLVVVVVSRQHDFVPTTLAELSATEPEYANGACCDDSSVDISDPGVLFYHDAQAGVDLTEEAFSTRFLGDVPPPGGRDRRKFWRCHPMSAVGVRRLLALIRKHQKQLPVRASAPHDSTSSSSSSSLGGSVGVVAAAASSSSSSSASSGTAASLIIAKPKLVVGTGPRKRPALGPPPTSGSIFAVKGACSEKKETSSCTLQLFADRLRCIVPGVITQKMDDGDYEATEDRILFELALAPHVNVRQETSTPTPKHPSIEIVRAGDVVFTFQPKSRWSSKAFVQAVGAAQEKAKQELGQVLAEAAAEFASDAATAGKSEAAAAAAAAAADIDEEAAREGATLWPQPPLPASARLVTLRVGEDKKEKGIPIRLAIFPTEDGRGVQLVDCETRGNKTRVRLSTGTLAPGFGADTASSSFTNPTFGTPRGRRLSGSVALVGDPRVRLDPLIVRGCAAVASVVRLGGREPTALLQVLDEIRDACSPAAAAAAAAAAGADRTEAKEDDATPRHVLRARSLIKGGLMALLKDCGALSKPFPGAEEYHRGWPQISIAICDVFERVIAIFPDVVPEQDMRVGELSLSAAKKAAMRNLDVIADEVDREVGSGTISVSPAITAPKPALILYTSGSTGRPKGAIMSSRTFNREVCAYISTNDYDGSGVAIVDAPMAVSATPYNALSTLLNGGRVAIYANLARVFEVAKQIAPTAIGAVPQIWNMLYKQYMFERTALVNRLRREKNKDAASGGAQLEDAASDAELTAELEADVAAEEKEDDKKGEKDEEAGGGDDDDDDDGDDDETAAVLVLDGEYRESLGHRISSINCGGAKPIPAVQAWLKRIFVQCAVSENYAATECGNITNSGKGYDGLIQDGVQVKLVDHGEYTSRDKPFPRGEICVKTPIMALGYLNRPDLTAKAWDKEGFYHTGDIGEMRDAQHVRIIDRIKNIFKLQNGEWVSPEHVEAVYLRCPSIQQIFIHGSSSHPAVVAVVVAKDDNGAAQGQHATTAAVGDGAHSAAREEPPRGIVPELRAEAAAAGLRHFELPRFIFVLPRKETWSIDNKMLTASAKLCRWQLRKKYRAELQGLMDQTLEEDAQQMPDSAALLVRLLRAALARGVLDDDHEEEKGHDEEKEDVEEEGDDEEDDEEGEALAATQAKEEARACRDFADLVSSWDSAGIIHAKAMIKEHFGIHVGIETLEAAASGTADAAAAGTAAAAGQVGPLAGLRRTAALIARAQARRSNGGGGGGGGGTEDAEQNSDGVIPVRRLLNACKLPRDLLAGLDVDVDHAPAPAPAADGDKTDSSSVGRLNILLTGATGFVGTCLLHRLVLELSSARDKGALPGGFAVYCLVREKGGAPAAQRLRTALVDSKLAQDHCASSSPSPPPNGGAGPVVLLDVPRRLANGDIVVVTGDLAKPRLGLDPAAFVDLARGVRHVIHCGSWVNHVRSFKTLRPSNVGSTLEIIRLAAVGQALRRRSSSGAAAAAAAAAAAGKDATAVHYLSSTSVLRREDAPEFARGNVGYISGSGGYVQTKWVSEMLLRKARRRGLVSSSSTLLRLGLVTPDTRTGAANLADWLTRFISGSILLGGYRVDGDGDGGDARVAVTAADHAASLICILCLGDVFFPAPRAAGTEKKDGDKKEPLRSLHLPLTIQMPTKRLLNLVAASPALLGRRMRIFGASEWRDCMSTLPSTNPLFPFRAAFPEGLGAIPGHRHEKADAVVTAVAKHGSGGGGGWSAESLRAAAQSWAGVRVVGGKGGDGEKTAAGQQQQQQQQQHREYVAAEVDRMVDFVMARHNIASDAPLMMRTLSVQAEAESLRSLDTRIEAAVRKVWEYHHMRHEIDREFSEAAEGVLVFCSSDISVADEAARLWLELSESRQAAGKPPPFLLFSGGFGTGMHSGQNLMGWDRPEAEMLAERAMAVMAELRAGAGGADAGAAMDASDVLVENRATNTGENADFSKRLLLEKLRLKATAAIVVQKPFMERRTFATVRRRWPELDIRVKSCRGVSGLDEYARVAGIQKDDCIGIMLGDLQRIKRYAPPHGDFQIAQDIPDDVWAAFEFLTSSAVCASKPQFKANLLRDH